MRVFHNLSALSLLPKQPIHLALGVFDGVHRGHHAVLNATIKRAREAGGLAGVVSFSPHPLSILSPHKAPKLLTPTQEKKEELLASLGFDFFLIIAFTPLFSQWEAGFFLNQLKASFSSPLSSLAMGKDWTFGKQKGGNVEFLKQWAEPRGCTIDAVEPLCHQGLPISSTRIRDAISQGDILHANTLLGYSFSYEGRVIRGEQNGRKIGFPTANIRPLELACLPPDGVWSSQVLLPNKPLEKIPAIANLGYRPSLNGRIHQLEVHLLDTSLPLEGENALYNKPIEVFFEHFLRKEKRFENLAALQTQITSDIAHLRQYL